MAKTDQFDRFAERYDGWFDRNMALFASELKAIRMLLPPGRRWDRDRDGDLEVRKSPWHPHRR